MTTARQAAGQALNRISELNDRLHAVIGTDPGALKRADILDDERRNGRERGPLHGLPVLIKDNIDTAGMATTAGSTALQNNRSLSDAPAVAALRAAGAVVIGKANLSEWANFRSTRSTSGWSALGGLTANPYALDRSAGGSSSGSAAAVAAGLVPVSLGTETDGSIVCPASLCGCVGLKPTVGSISSEGVVPIAASQDTVGPIAQTVRLAAAAFDAMSGGRHRGAIDQGVGGLRIGLARSTGWGLRSDVSDLCEAAVKALAGNGAVLVDDVSLTAPPSIDEDELKLLLFEFHAGIEGYLASHPDAGAASLADLIAHNQADPGELVHFGQEIFEQAVRTGGLDSTEYLDVKQRCHRAGRHDGIDATLAKDELDAIAVPSFMPAWKSDLISGDPESLYSPSRLPALAGYPALTVPVGLVGGLPVGLMLIGGAHSESVLLRLGEVVERGLEPLPAPTLREPTAG